MREDHLFGKVKLKFVPITIPNCNQSKKHFIFEAKGADPVVTIFRRPHSRHLATVETMSLVNERSANRAASVLNSKPNVDEVDNNLKELLGQSRVPASNNFLYCLPHHHFKLDKGEVLLFDVKEGADGKVEKVSVSVGPYKAGLHPFQYLSDGKEYVPIGFTSNEKFKCEKPEFHFPELGIISNAFTDGMVEETSHEKRVQVFNIEKTAPSNALITMMGKTEDGTLETPYTCVLCTHPQGDGVRQFHRRTWV